MKEGKVRELFSPTRVLQDTKEEGKRTTALSDRLKTTSACGSTEARLAVLSWSMDSSSAKTAFTRALRTNVCTSKFRSISLALAYDATTWTYPSLWYGLCLWNRLVFRRYGLLLDDLLRRQRRWG